MDLRNFANIKKLIDKNTDIVVLAGLVGDPITKKYFDLANSINRKGVGNLIDSIKKLEFKKFIFISTCSNYGLSKSNNLLTEESKLMPISKYAKDKVFIEKKLLSLKKISFCQVILRFATAFGLSKRMRFDLTVNEFVKRIFLNENLEIYDYETYRPYCHTLDFSRAIQHVISIKDELVFKECFNVGNKDNNFKNMKVKKPNIKFVNKSFDRRNYRVNFKKIENKLNFKTKYSLSYGIKEIYNFLKSNEIKDDNKYGNYKI